MSSKTALNDIFLYNTFCLANLFFHQPFTNRNLLNSKLKKLSDSMKASFEDVKYSYNYLQQNGILYEVPPYSFVNFSLLKKLVREKGRRGGPFVILQPNFELLIRPEIAPSDFWFLIQIAELKQKDVVYRFLITENSLHNAFTNRIGAEEIRRFLLSGAGKEKLQENIDYFIDEIAKRTGEIRINRGAGFLVTKGHILKNLVHDEKLKKSLIRTLTPTVSLIHEKADVLDMFYYLKSKRYFPVLDMDKVEVSGGGEDVKLFLNKRECEYLLTAFYTLRDVGFEHDVRVNVSTLNNLIDQIEQSLSSDKSAVSRAVERSVRYKEDLKRSIKNYVLKSMKASLVLPDNLVLNRISEQYDGENPATLKKEIIRMVEFALKHKLKLLVSYYLLSHTKVDKVVELKYLYDSRVLYYHDRNTKKDDTVALDRIIFTMLL